MISVSFKLGEHELGISGVRKTCLFQRRLLLKHTAAGDDLECQNCKARNLERSKPISVPVTLSYSKLDEKLVTGE